MIVKLQTQNSRRFIASYTDLEADAPDAAELCNLVLEAVMVLLGDLQRLAVLRHPGRLLRVPLQDGEEDDQQRGVGGVQHLAPHTRAQDVHLLGTTI